MKIEIVRFDDIEKTDLGGGSWAKELLTEKTVNTQKTMLGVSVFKPGTGTATRIHKEEELAYILQGEGVLECSQEKVEVVKGTAVFIPPGVKHGLRNIGDEDLIMVYVFSYPKYPPTDIIE